jgi:hypothetical protein
MGKYILAFSTDRPTGSIGGSTFQRSGKVFAIRKRNVPVQKKTPKQSEVKNKFDHVQKNWKNLSLAEQQTFTDEATNYPRLDSLGNPYTLLGSNLQASSNLNLLAAGESEITSIPPPSPIPVPVFTSYAFNPSGFFFAINFVPVIVPAGYSLNIYIGPTTQANGEEPSIKSMKLIKVFGPGVNNSVDFSSEWNAAWTNRIQSPNPRYAWVKCFYIQLATGQRGDSLDFLSVT